MNIKLSPVTKKIFAYGSLYFVAVRCLTFYILSSNPTVEINLHNADVETTSYKVAAELDAFEI